MARGTIQVCSECGFQTPSGSGSAPAARRGTRSSRSASRRARARRVPVSGRGGGMRAAGGAAAVTGPNARPTLAERGRYRAGGAHGHGHRRARSRAGRRARSGRAGAAGRLAGDRQVDADEHGARQPGRSGTAHAVCERRGVRRAGEAARRAALARRARVEGPDPRGDRPRHRPWHTSPERPPRYV